MILYDFPAPAPPDIGAQVYVGAGKLKADKINLINKSRILVFIEILPINRRLN